MRTLTSSLKNYSCLGRAVLWNKTCVYHIFPNLTSLSNGPNPMDLLRQREEHPAATKCALTAYRVHNVHQPPTSVDLELH